MNPVAMCFEAPGCALLLVTPPVSPNPATYPRPVGAAWPFLLPGAQLGSCPSVSQLGMLRAPPCSPPEGSRVTGGFVLGEDVAAA